MIILSDAQGNIQNITPARVYQGSNEANDFNLIAPFANSNIVTIGFLLPNTVDGTPQEFAQMEQPKTLTENLNTWTYKLPVAITQYYGTVRYQFKVTNQTGIVIATGSGTFEVIRGADVDLPVEPTQDVYSQILVALAQVYADMTNKVNVTYTDVANALEQKILNNASYLAIQRTHNGITNTLSFDDDGVKLNGVVIGTVGDIATAISNHNTSSTAHADIRASISNILDGTTPVAEATHATSASNVTITNNDTGNNSNVNFSIGTGAYNKTINNVANATSASDYNVGGAIDRELKLIKQIALDRENALVFDSNAQISSWIAGTYERPDGKTVADLTIGLTIYNRTSNQNDYWVSQLPVTSISDLTPFESDVNPLDAINVEFNANINENRLEADNVQEAIDELTNIADEKTNIYELGQFTLESTDWALNSTSGLYEYVFTNEYLTSATKEIIEVTPSVESAELINSNNLVIYNDIEIRQGVSAVEAVIKAQSAPSFDIVCYVRLKTVAMRLSGAGSLHASQVTFVNTGTGLGATNVQSAITEINTKANTNASSIGTLSSLDTTAKTDLVSAVNEVNTNANNALPKSDITYFNYNINNIYITSGAYNASNLYGPVTGRLKGIKVGNKIVGVFDITLLPSDMITTGTILVDYIHFGLDLGLSGSWGSSSIRVDSYQSNGIATIDINDTLSTTDVITKVAFPNSTNGWEFSFNKTNDKFYNSRYELRLLLPVEIQLKNLLTGEM